MHKNEKKPRMKKPFLAFFKFTKIIYIYQRKLHNNKAEKSEEIFSA